MVLMSITQPDPPSFYFDDYGVIAFRGADARSFLQGQLSQDVLTLEPGEVRLASLNNPQGRCLVILYVLADRATDLLAVTHAAQALTLATTLRRYVLRSKVRIEDESARYRLQAHWQAPASPTAEQMICWPHTSDGRWLCLQPEAIEPLRSPSTEQPSQTKAAAQAAWQRADIAAGRPHLQVGTEGEFVAQMLNLDAQDAISFKKGCYTGQEVIARAHFRGKVKRRLQRFELERSTLDLPTAITAPAPGASITLSDGRHAAVINAIPTSETHVECLAVTTFAGAPLPESRALPYSLPD
jgi:folate-binding protein YgfZ